MKNWIEKRYRKVDEMTKVTNVSYRALRSRAIELDYNIDSSKNNPFLLFSYERKNLCKGALGINRAPKAA